MNEGDTRLEDFFLRFILENNKELEEMLEVKLDGFWNIKQQSNEVLLAQGTGDDGQSDISIYLNIGERYDKRFVAKIQDLIARAGEGEDNYILCIAREFDNADIEELMQDTIFYRKCMHLVFLTLDINEESEEINFKDIIKEQMEIKVYKKTY